MRLSPLAAVLLGAFPAFAQGSNTAAAEAFFQDGRALFDQGRYAEACPKLAESQRLDPATGTLLALALCHEGEGKLASAWAEFTDVEGRARSEGRADRERVASEHAAALRSRLSTLAVDVPAEVVALPGLVVKVDGVAVGTASFGVGVPVDGGEHRVDATAPGKTSWQGAVTVKVEKDSARIAVPVLGDAPLDKTTGAPTSRSDASKEVARADDKGSGMRTAALVTAGAGIVALGIGGYLALDAKGDYSSALKKCVDRKCDPAPYDEVERAQKQGNVATIVFVVGGAAIATGGVLWFLAPANEEETQPAVGQLRLKRVGLAPRGLVFEGSF